MNVYLGTFLIGFTTLALEVTLTRLLSVITWYYLAFFAISTAMLGMTAGATTVYLRPKWFTPDKLDDNVATACLGYAIVVPFSLTALCMMPLTPNPCAMALVVMLSATVACGLPFYFSGIVVSVVLTKYDMPIGKLYASDLIGASLGCLFVLGGLEIMDAPSLMLACATIGVLAVFSYAWRSTLFRFRRASRWVFGLLVLFTMANSLTSYGIRPLVVKENLLPPNAYILEKWNSFSRVVVFGRRERTPQYWGPSPVAPMKPIITHGMDIDGDAGTVMRRFSSMEDIDHLHFDVVNAPYYLRPKGGACIIGVGGGRDIQSAILFGHQRVLGLEINPIFINLLKGRFCEFAGIADRKEVSLVIDEARSYLSRSHEKFSLVQMSLIDTWAATGAGAFSLSENALYTVEAWQVFLSRLEDTGIFTVSRWYSPSDPAETGRLVSLAVASLLQSGIMAPSQHVALITCGRISTLVLSKMPLTSDDITKLKEVAAEMKYDIAILPGSTPQNSTLKNIVCARSLEELDLAIQDAVLNYSPPTDENPYFFNMLRLSKIFHSALRTSWKRGVLGGNLFATLTLAGLIVSLLIVTVFTILVPLLIKRRSEKMVNVSKGIFWSGALYFSLIGAGFMLVEIALLQRLSVFLGHPVYALGILLFTIIASTGIGSFLSERLPLTRPPWVFVYPVAVAVTILMTRLIVSYLIAGMITSSILSRTIASVLVLFPLGASLGFCFPIGMRLLKAVNAGETPWYWALNGIFGVLCSALAVFISIYLSISVNFYISAACYAATLIGLYFVQKAVVGNVSRTNHL